jgi:transposase
MCEGQKIEETF